MSAAQLLRILQTSSSDVKYETCVFDTAEPREIMKENQNGILCHYNSFGKEADPVVFTMREKFQFLDNDREVTTDPLASDTKDRENLPNSAELECLSKAKDFIRRTEIESKSSAVSDTNIYADKNITEYELPELEISCKEVSYHVVKDICIDDGIPKEETTAGVGLTGSCLEYSKDVLVNECGTKGEDGDSVPIGPKSASKISFDKGTTGECDPKDAIQAGVTPDDATEKVEYDLSEEGSFVNSMLPLQEFGTRSFLRSFLDSLNSEEKEVAQQFDQIPSGEVKKVQSSNLSYNSKMESESITFNFNSPIETVDEQYVKSEDNHHSDTSPVQRTRPKDSIGNVREHVKDDNYDNSSSTCSRGNTAIIENVEISPNHNDRSDNQSLGQILFAGRKDKITRNADDQPLKTTNTSKHGDGNLKAQWDDAHGESSFSAGDHDAYSGPIPFSGSLSVRSESSAATSTRSFAFPVLQSEWNSSPVRMAKADDRHFRKRKDWRSGLLCCRF